MVTHHVFLTRFNLPSNQAENLIRAREGWLRDRIELFEHYTVPSVQHQTAPSAGWLVYLDPQSPDWLLERMDRHARRGVLTPVLREDAPREALVADLRTRVDPGKDDRLVTTNLDNEDGLARDFVARLCAAEVPAPRAALYLTRGLVRSRHRLYARRDRRNAFCSVSEPATCPVTCWCDWHNLLGRSMPVVELDGPPAWLQVVHGANVSNRVRGRLVDPDPHRGLFGTLVEDVPRPGARALLRDSVISWPARIARESGRSSGRRLVMSVGGKEGMDRVRTLLLADRRSS